MFSFEKVPIFFFFLTFHTLSFTSVSFKDVFTDYANGTKKGNKFNPSINLV